MRNAVYCLITDHQGSQSPSRTQHISWGCTSHHAQGLSLDEHQFCLQFYSLIKSQTKLKWPMFSSQYRLLNWPKLPIAAGRASSSDSSYVEVHGLHYWQSANNLCWHVILVLVFFFCCFFVVKWHFLVQSREVGPFSFTLLPFVYAFSAAIYVLKSYSIWQLTTVMEILIWIVDSSSATMSNCCAGDIVTEGHSIWNSLNCQWKLVLQVEMKTMLKVFPSQQIMNCYYNLSPAKKHPHERLPLFWVPAFQSISLLIHM